MDIKQHRASGRAHRPRTEVRGMSRSMVASMVLTDGSGRTVLCGPAEPDPKPEAMSREEFKRRWDAREPITYDEIADCYVAWGLGSYPRTKPIDSVMDRVLKAADCEWDDE